ncbi:MAG: hypothetical protein K0M55_06915 [Rhizobium sp.]|nr:hypothetical protein [Rhizobium sp.]
MSEQQTDWVPRNEHNEVVTELTERLMVLEALCSLMIAELSITSSDVRVTLEDILWQAQQNEVDPSHEEWVKAVTLSQYRRIEDFLANVNKTLTKPLKPAPHASRTPK